ncbi:hypothetical protein Y032_0009g609 [Ancylostoma ceylanicum]|uniref:Uncharacterized protein n=1 Tax=Ancylostoma ceylanicum TaxID=53326 RepID=A0A016VIX7_9BILA|nr:hypothetical protein Y032_0009g609 [Ancylostoma ceylanicum]
MPGRGDAMRPTDARSRRCCAAHRCPIAAMLCGAQLPDRGCDVRPIHDPRQLHNVGGRERRSATQRPLSSGTTLSEDSLTSFYCSLDIQSVRVHQ